MELQRSMWRARFLPHPQIEQPVEKPKMPEIPEQVIYPKKSAVPAQIARESDPLLPETPFPRVKEIQKACCRYFDISMVELISDRRLASLVKARHVAMYLAKTLTPHSYPEIARRFGGRDHTTILHACRKMNRILPDSPDLQAAVETISNVFKVKES